jgi:hypothetical protein
MTLAEFARHFCPVAYTVPGFCKAHHFSESYYYELRESGFGPRETKLGTRTIITAESAAEWRRERTETPVPPKKVVP